jgi:aryl-alcohol dehydrogenase-like predicted oxidoreductase
MMSHRRMGRSGLKVPAVGLGCGSTTFAGRADQATATNIIARALDLDINFFDTAETYAEGRSETLLGRALVGRRSQAIIATKFGKDRSVGPNESPSARRSVIRAVEGSLKRLNTDYIDLYIMHEPDPDTPIAETLGTLDDLIRAGKVRYIACSEFSSWQLCEALWTSDKYGYEAFIAASSFYSLLNRRPEDDLIPCCRKFGIGMVPTAPLAGGFLTGKYRRDVALPAGSRFDTPAPFANPVRQDLGGYRKLLNDENFARLARLKSFAEQRGHTVGELAIAWLLADAAVATVPVGVTRSEQLDLHVAAASWTLTREEWSEVSVLH